MPDTVTYADAPAAAVVDLRANPATVGAHGADTLTVADGSALRFVGTAYNDVIRGTYHDDVLLGRGGDDQVFGQDGDDRILPDGDDSAGADLVDGGGGEDRIESVAGYDTLVGGIGGGHHHLHLGQPVGDQRRWRRRHHRRPGAGGVGLQVLGGPGQDKLRMLAYRQPGRGARRCGWTSARA